MILITPYKYNKKIYIDPSKIMYVEVTNRKTQITMPSLQFEIKESFKEIHNKLPNEQFVLIFRGIIVNLKYIDKITNNMVVINNNNIKKLLPVSRRQYRILYERFFEFSINNL